MHRAGCEKPSSRTRKKPWDVNSIQYSGQEKAGGLGQNWSRPSHGTPPSLPVYTKTIDYASRSSKEELTRTQMNPPDRGGEAPFAGEQNK